MEWQPWIEELARRRALAAELGGPERVDRQPAAGKSTCRERIDQLLGAGSFREVGSLAGWAAQDAQGEIVDFTPANFVAGRGTIDGRPTIVGADDFTVRGGHADAGIRRKQVHAQQLSRELAIPMVRLIDGSSGGETVKTYLEEDRTYVPPLPGFEHQVAMLAEVPVATAILGPVVGLGAARAMTSHLSVMVAGVGQVSVTGPPIVAHATAEEVDREQLGGVDVHGPVGSVDVVVETEEAALGSIRRFPGVGGGATP